MLSKYARKSVLHVGPHFKCSQNNALSRFPREHMIISSWKLTNCHLIMSSDYKTLMLNLNLPLYDVNCTVPHINYCALCQQGFFYYIMNM